MPDSNVPKGSPLAYLYSIHRLTESLTYELSDCKNLYGTDPAKLLDYLLKPVTPGTQKTPDVSERAGQGGLPTLPSFPGEGNRVR